MELNSINRLVKPLLKAGISWQHLDINGKGKRPKFFFSVPQWILLLLSIAVLFHLKNGLSDNLIGYVMSAFAISVSLFMSLLVSIFDKFENTDFGTTNKSAVQIARLKQKRNFFKKFISITSYLVVLSIFLILLTSLSFVFDLSSNHISWEYLCFNMSEIDIILTLKNAVIFAYRIILNYCLLNYLLLTFFIAGSAYEYYMSELNSVNL